MTSAISSAIGANYIPQQAGAYPGNYAEFEVTQDWNQLLPTGRNSEKCRELIFSPKSPSTVFLNVRVLGFTNGSIRLWAEMLPVTKGLTQTYLKKMGIEGYNFYLAGALIIDGNPEKQNKLIDVMASHNKFPEEEIKLVRALIAAQNWEIVTPRQAVKKFM